MTKQTDDQSFADRLSEARDALGSCLDEMFLIRRSPIFRGKNKFRMLSAGWNHERIEDENQEFRACLDVLKSHIRILADHYLKLQALTATDWIRIAKCASGPSGQSVYLHVATAAEEFISLFDSFNFPNLSAECASEVCRELAKNLSAIPDLNSTIWRNLLFVELSRAFPDNAHLEKTYLDLVVDHNTRTVKRGACARTVRLNSRFPLFLAMFSAGEPGITKATAEASNDGEIGGALRTAISDIRDKLAPLDVTIPDGEFRLVSTKIQFMKNSVSSATSDAL